MEKARVPGSRIPVDRMTKNGYILESSRTLNPNRTEYVMRLKHEKDLTAEIKKVTYDGLGTTAEIRTHLRMRYDENGLHADIRIERQIEEDDQKRTLEHHFQFPEALLLEELPDIEVNLKSIALMFDNGHHETLGEDLLSIGFATMSSLFLKAVPHDDGPLVESVLKIGDCMQTMTVDFDPILEPFYIFKP